MAHHGPHFGRPSTSCATLPSNPRQGSPFSPFRNATNSLVGMTAQPRRKNEHVLSTVAISFLMTNAAVAEEAATQPAKGQRNRRLFKTSMAPLFTRLTPQRGPSNQHPFDNSQSSLKANRVVMQKIGCTLQIPRIHCIRCDGTGRVGRQTCNDCHGHGYYIPTKSNSEEPSPKDRTS